MIGKNTRKQRVNRYFEDTFKQMQNELPEGASFPEFTGALVPLVQENKARIVEAMKRKRQMQYDPWQGWK